MKEYGWTLEQYEDQPAWLIDMARRKMEIEAKLQEAKQNNAG